MVSLKHVIAVLGILLLVASCSGDDESQDETDLGSTTAAPITTLANDVEGDAQLAESAVTTTTTTTVAPELAFPKYSIVSREASESGDVVVVLLDPTTYESLSDIDVHNVMSDLVEEFAPVFEAHVVESQAAADALFEEDPTEAQQAALDRDYIARLEEGFRIVYVGPLEASGVAILGS